jgi:hypothetical protein
MPVLGRLALMVRLPSLFSPNLREVVKGIPGWVGHTVLALDLCLWGLGGYLKGRADANARAKVLD